MLKSLRRTEALVPSTWHVELANLLLRDERRRLIENHDTQRFLAQVESLPITVDLDSHEEVIRQNLQLAREHQISNFTAAYLSLGLRTGYSVATTQPDLLTQLRKCKIERYEIVED